MWFTLFIFLFFWINFVSSQRRRPFSSSYSEESPKNPKKILSTEEYLLSPTFSDSSTNLTYLWKKTLTFDDILTYHHYYNLNPEFHVKGYSYNKETLAYITPWNKKGYRMAKLMKIKLTWLCPVWFQIRKLNSQIQVSGIHDIDNSWLQDIQSSQTCDTTLNDSHEFSSQENQYNNNSSYCIVSNVKVVPRVIFETSMTEKQVIQISNELYQLSLEYHFHGYTLEVGNMFDRGIELSRLLKGKGLRVLFVLPPILVQSSNEINLLQAVASSCDRISVMTYDRSSKQQTDLSNSYNAPFPWVASIIHSLSQIDESMSQKLLLGIPMYGWKGNEAMTSETLLIWLAKHNYNINIIWNEENQEHLFVKNTHQMEISSYPTPLFIQKRLEFVMKNNIGGIALWELGQMMSTFITLF